jgi:hypothetical protein
MVSGEDGRELSDMAKIVTAMSYKEGCQAEAPCQYLTLPENGVSTPSTMYTLHHATKSAFTCPKRNKVDRNSWKVPATRATVTKRALWPHLIERVPCAPSSSSSYTAGNRCGVQDSLPPVKYPEY